MRERTYGHKKKAFVRAASVFSAAIFTLFAAFALSGCSLLDYIFASDDVAFTVRRINLTVGDEYDLTRIIESESSSYYLSVSDPKIATVRNRVLTARSAGTTRVTVETDTDSDTLTVNVAEAEADSFDVTSDGSLVGIYGEMTPVIFTPVAKGAYAAETVKWYVDGAIKKIGMSYDTFEFAPSGVGVYEIKAVCGDVERISTVRAYNRTEARVTRTGDADQSEPYKAIVYTAEVESVEQNPECFIDWRVDGVSVQSGASLTFTYTPATGRHTVEAYVNGARVFGEDCVFRGAVVPKTPAVRFDNCYPHFYIEYAVEGAAKVQITSPSGAVSEYSQNNSAYSDRFSDGAFDAKELISACASSSTRGSYTVRVKSLGDGDAFAESEYSEAYTFTQLPSAAAEYVQTIVTDFDLYVTSEEEYTAVAEYYIMFRNKRSTPSKVSFECYAGFELSGSAEDMWNNAFPIAATSGTYNRIDVRKSGNVIYTSFNVNTLNAPSTQSSAYELKRDCSEQLHAVLPHINYDESKYRSADDVFPIDGRERTQSVYYSDELYLAAQNNTRPVPATGSPAESIYTIARGVAGKICTPDMTDKQKAHAIYDWIMWQVTYDTPATETETGGEKIAAYYLEGVFGDGSTKIGGRAYLPYAVCDGMSKAYSLLCNIEGIPCRRVVGEAGSNPSDLGGHAWNKVFVDGNWYFVDCTWGDSIASISIDGRTKKVCELGLHDQLFLTDAQTSGTHYEPYMKGDSNIVYAPRTTAEKYNVYADMVYNGTAIDCHIKKNENMRERLRAIASEFARTNPVIKKISVPGGTENGNYDLDCIGFDVYVDNVNAMTDGEIRSVVQSAVRAHIPSARVNTLAVDNVILVLISQ